MAKFLDQSGVAYLWGKVKNAFVPKAEGKDLSSNDYTDVEKTKLAGIAEGANKYTHPNTAGNKHIPAGGADGQLLTYSAAGTAQWSDPVTYAAATQSADGLMAKEDKAKLDGFTSAGDYAKKTDIATVMRYKGSVTAKADLPTGAVVGDVYNVENENDHNFAWNGTAWDDLGGTFTVESIANADIDTICV